MSLPGGTPACIYKSNSPFYSYFEDEMEYCPNFQAAMISVDDTGQKIAVAARCKKWGCDYCAAKNRKKWLAVLLDHINKSGLDWCWFTLTATKDAHNSVDPAKYTLLNLRGAWDTLIKRMRRKYGKFEYCRVYEKHTSGAFHLHCIRSGSWPDAKPRNKGKDTEYMDSDWLRKNATSLGLGYMTHADNIESGKAGSVAFYVVKYMTKIEGNFEEWQGVRRIQTSRGIKYNQPPKLKWEIRSGLYLSDLELSGTGYVLLDTEDVFNSDYFLEHSVWPPLP